ncbi:MAG TPA: hypothetical protein VKS82_04135 [Streptosporangiaceae bacterium]|nr:hypothetical protein [Streptosporangiaceae bacterium]
MITDDHTRQRNLRHLFTWLEEAYDHPHPYTDALHRYAPVLTKPSTLAQEFIADMLEVTGGGRARDFENARDHAIIRMLTEGVRRTEVAQQRTDDLSADPIARPFVRVVPLKGARAASEGRIVPLSSGLPRAGGLPAGAPDTSQGQLARTVAGNQQPRADDRVGGVPDAEAPGRPGRLRARS